MTKSEVGGAFSLKKNSEDVSASRNRVEYAIEWWGVAFSLKGILRLSLFRAIALHMKSTFSVSLSLWQWSVSWWLVAQWCC